MTRSKNSRRGATNSHAGRHHVCVEGPNCPYCIHNRQATALRQKQKGTNDVRGLKRTGKRDKRADESDE